MNEKVNKTEKRDMCKRELFVKTLPVVSWQTQGSCLDLGTYRQLSQDGTPLNSQDT